MQPTSRHLLVTAVLLTVAMQQADAQSTPGISPGTQTQAPAPTVPLYQPQDYSGDSTVSYVRTFDPQQPYTTDAAVLAATATNQVHQTTAYFDGLGRPIETVAWQMSPSGLDIVSPEIYDNFGREQYTFLPYESTESNGLFKSLAFSSQNNFYTNIYPSQFPAFKGEQVFYGQTQFELSPLDRPQLETAPGNSWTGNGVGVSTQYMVNDTTDLVPVWEITLNAPADGNNWPTTTYNYANGTLYKTITTDERGSEVIEFKDMQGQVVEKEVQAANALNPADPYTGWLVTMYVYDNQNQLRVVIPPKAVDQLKANNWTFTQAIIDGLCFRYEYDLRKRVIGKVVPGGGWTWIVYNEQDQPVFTQTPNLAVQGEWMTTLYDALDRPVLTGMTTYSGTQAQLQALVNTATTNPSAGTQTNTNTGVSGIAPNLTVTTRQIGVTSYQATGSIVFAPGFTPEAGATFVAQITTGSPNSTTATSTVMGNPIPSGSTFIPLTEHFYDNYTWGTTKTYSTLNNAKLDYGTNAYADPLPSPASPNTQGLPTGTRVRVLEDSANLTLGGWLETVSYYDGKGRVVQTQGDNYKGGADTLTERYDFTGKVVSSYEAHGNPQASTWLRIKTNNNYDGTGRLTNVVKEVDDNPATQRTIAQYTYSRLGQLMTKQIGQTLGSNGSPTGTPLETQAYDYNIRGWLKGINRGYANPSLGITGGGTWFGEDIAYDWGFDSAALNGNISGIQWRSGGNGQQRAYGYSYDRANRLLYADFNQLFGSSWAKNDPNGGQNNDPSLNIDFSVQMGDGKTCNTAYDDNGNILAMQQKGLVVNASPTINHLTYSYGSTSPGNQLQAVSDVNTANYHLGEFRDGNTSGNDYNYDPNGNLLWDKNKGISWITNDHLNLPCQVAVTPTSGAKGTVTYIYDALGDKLEKRVMETADATDGQQTTYTNTDYIGPFVYQNNVLQFFGQEEGRIRPLTDPLGLVQPDTLEYDYFLRDHLGDTRMILTDQQRTDAYPMATMETGDSSLENGYYANLDPTRTAISSISGYPTDNTTNPNNCVAAVGGSHSSVKIGPSITLKVMAQDQVYIRASSWYQGGTSPSYLPLPVTNLVSALSGGLATVASAAETGGAVLPTSGLLQPDAAAFIGNQPVPNPSSPKAYLNWVFFDDQFRFVSQGSGSVQVTVNSGTVNALAPSNGYVTAQESGYVYIYVSNADSLTTVYFDNLQVSHVHGPLTEEEHYYPFGLLMSGISDKALKTNYAQNKYRFNGKELQNQEFSDGTGLEEYDYGARFQDPQLGRWQRIDPLADSMRVFSPYTYAFDNPIRFIDYEGAFPFPVTVRAFAPTGAFNGASGLGFSDDGRGFSASNNVTSRISQTTTIDPTAGTVTGGTPTSSTTKWFGIPSGNATNFTDDGGVDKIFSSRDNGTDVVSVDEHFTGSNPTFLGGKPPTSPVIF